MLYEIFFGGEIEVRVGKGAVKKEHGAGNSIIRQFGNLAMG
jgi:hypothetical protein